MSTQGYNLHYLDTLEAESIHIFREVAASCKKPVMMYSIGKDSSVLLHLARKAFAPGPVPFPILHIDTTFKFREMIAFRDALPEKYQLDLIVHTNQKGVEMGMNPFDYGSQVYTDTMKTDALKQALLEHKFDAAIGGARRDEEASRSKERIFSFRDEQQQWDPKNQRPELWNVYNTQIKAGQSVRVFPLSNWTEFDIWHYILRENIEIVPLYFAKERPVVMRNDTLIMVDDDRLPLEHADEPEMKSVRFRTLGCYPLTGAIESSATTVEDIIAELLASDTTERKHRLIDSDQPGSMEEKKKIGYF